MSKYLNSLNNEIKEYFQILSSDFPKWLIDYIETPEMQRISNIALSCGTDYTKVFNPTYYYSNLEHSIGVALIVWNFTKDKKQALAGLFHDIATPVFKHVIDFLNNDHEKQESTEEKTAEIIMNSKEIMSLLKRDNIKLEEVIDYKKYPIADNNSPQLSADRFEYIFSSGLVFYRVWNLKDIKECYDNITILTNEDGNPELGFNNIKVCEKYIRIVSDLWPTWISNADKSVMQFLADIIKAMIEKNYLITNDLYILSEEEIINKILNCEDEYLSQSFIKFQNMTTVYDSDVEINDKYCVSIKAKRRYVIPLVKNEDKIDRIYNISPNAKNYIDNYLNNETSKYAYFDFDFKVSKKNLKI
ncbi:MAG: HD domain-containing protein [Bacilli bacterium]|nr:HD domain-containing protein [Bacilli bacterium]